MVSKYLEIALKLPLHLLAIARQSRVIFQHVKVDEMHYVSQILFHGSLIEGTYHGVTLVVHHDLGSLELYRYHLISL